MENFEKNIGLYTPEKSERETSIQELKAMLGELLSQQEADEANKEQLNAAIKLFDPAIESD